MDVLRFPDAGDVIVNPRVFSPVSQVPPLGMVLVFGALEAGDRPPAGDRLAASESCVENNKMAVSSFFMSLILLHRAIFASRTAF